MSTPNQPNMGVVNPFAYDVQTTYVPSTDDVVPAVPAPAAARFAPPGPPGPAPPAFNPGPANPAHVGLSFTETTASTFVSGNIGGNMNKGPAGPMPSGPSRPGPDDGHFGATQSSSPLVGPGASSSTAPGGSGSSADQDDHTKYPFYNVRRYRPYFNLDTKECLWRIGNSFIGAFRADFMRKTMESPDLYGPFWITTTLIVLVAVSGNFSSFLKYKIDQHKSSPSPPPGPAGSVSPSPSQFDEEWFADYTKMSAAAGLFYGYVFVLGTLLFLVLKYFKSEMKLFNVFCIYGYSLSIYLPVCIACVVPIGFVRWILVGVATLSSALFLLLNFKATIYQSAPAKAVAMLGIIFALHAGLGLALILFFFNY